MKVKPKKKGEKEEKKYVWQGETREWQQKRTDKEGGQTGMYGQVNGPQ